MEDEVSSETQRWDHSEDVKETKGALMEKLVVLLALALHHFFEPV